MLIIPADAVGGGQSNDDFAHLLANRRDFQQTIFRGNDADLPMQSAAGNQTRSCQSVRAANLSSACAARREVSILTAGF